MEVCNGDCLNCQHSDCIEGKDLAQAERRREYQRQWRLAHPDYKRKWNEAHPGKQQEYEKRSNAKRAERNRQYAKRWREQHPDYGRAWRERNAEKCREYGRNYYHRKKAKQQAAGT